jgi:5,10-methylenetetrahydromethanopterin reductase
MRFAIAIPTDADSWRLVRRAEELGFSRAWFYDTQMLSADPFVAMAAAAIKTTRIRLGTGVLIPSNRIATAADVASAAAALDEMRREWASAGHEADALDAVVLTGGVVLEEGEPADSPRAIAQAGPRAAMLLHRAADAALLGWPAIAAIPPAVVDTVASYVELARQFRPQGAPYLENHRGHLMFVKPEERPFVTAELIRLTTFAATERELKERIALLDAAGYGEIAIQIIPGQEHAIEDWGRIRRAFA